MTDRDHPLDELQLAPERDRAEPHVGDEDTSAGEKRRGPKLKATQLTLDPLGPADERAGQGSLTLDDPGDETETREAVKDLGTLCLDGDWREEPVRPRAERYGLSIGLALALSLHGTAVALAFAAFLAIGDQIGGDGRDLSSINVDLISVAALDEIRAQKRAQEDASRAATPARLAARAGAERNVAEAREAADAAPSSAPPPAASQATAALVAEPDEDANTPKVTVAPREGQQAAQTPAEQEPTEETAEPQPTPEATPTERSSAAPSRAVAAQAAQSAGGAPVRDLRETLPAPEPPKTATATTAAGRVATGYAKQLVEALADLEMHLQRSNDQRAKRARGRVELELTIGRDGRPTNLRVISSSGVTSLDRVALADVRGFRFPPPPAGLAQRQRTYRLPISYR